MGTPPTGLEHHSVKYICHFYNKKPRYVTLYNTEDHIPIYSAYTFKRTDGEICVDVTWMYEPQVKETRMLVKGFTSKMYETIIFFLQIFV